MKYLFDLSIVKMENPLANLVFEYPVDLGITDHQIQEGRGQISHRHAVNVAALKNYVDFGSDSGLRFYLQAAVAGFRGFFKKGNPESDFSGCAGGDEGVGDFTNHFSVHAFAIVGDRDGQCIFIKVLNYTDFHPGSASINAVLCDIQDMQRKLS